MTASKLAQRLESVLAAAETLRRAQEGDNDFATDAATKRLGEALDAWALQRFPQLRGRTSGIRRMILCAECGRLMEHAAKGLCHACRERSKPSGRPLRECVECHEVRPHMARGKCDACASRERRLIRGDSPRAMCVCLECRRKMEHAAHGLCGTCYQRRRSNAAATRGQPAASAGSAGPEAIGNQQERNAA